MNKKVVYSATFILLALFIALRWSYLSESGIQTNKTPKSSMHQPIAISTADVAEHTFENNSFELSHDSVEQGKDHCLSLEPGYWVNIIFNRSQPEPALTCLRISLIKLFADTPDMSLIKALRNDIHFFQLMILDFLYHEQLPPEIHLTALLKQLDAVQIQTLLIFVANSPEVRALIDDYGNGNGNGNSYNELLKSIIHFAAMYFSHSLLSLVTSDIVPEFNSAILIEMLNPSLDITLSDIWPVAIKATIHSDRDKILHKIIQHYLAKEGDSAFYYFADYFHFSTKEKFSSKFDLPSAVNTLNAWRFNQLNRLAAEDYNKDSTLVVEGISQMITRDPESFFMHVNLVESAPVQHKVIASIIQSTGFFELEAERLVLILHQQPRQLAHHLAKAYVLQFSHLPIDAYQEKTLLITEFLTSTN